MQLPHLSILPYFRAFKIATNLEGSNELVAPTNTPSTVFNSRKDFTLSEDTDPPYRTERVSRCFIADVTLKTFSGVSAFPVPIANTGS